MTGIIGQSGLAVEPRFGESKVNKMNRNNNMHAKKREQGFVLMLTLFAALIMSALIIAFVNIQTMDLSLIKNNMSSKKAYYIAEAGIADAFNEIRTNGLVTDTQWESNFPVGSSDTYSVAVSQNGKLITSTGNASTSNFSRTLEVILCDATEPHLVAVDQFREITP